LIGIEEGITEFLRKPPGSFFIETLCTVVSYVSRTPYTYVVQGLNFKMYVKRLRLPPRGGEVRGMASLSQVKISSGCIVRVTLEKIEEKV
jgi:hypothetical protein